MLASILLIVNALWNFDSSQWNIKNYTIKSGLNSNRIYRIVQDHRGRYWIASNAGLAHFDGYQFTYLTSENGVKNVDLINAVYFNNYVYTTSINKLEIINMTSLNSKQESRQYEFDIKIFFGFDFNNGLLATKYDDSLNIYKGINVYFF